MPTTDISKLGIREHTKRVVAPVVAETRNDGTKIMEIRSVQKKFKVAQPILSFSEAKKLGRQKWHPFRKTDLMTCVVDSRRFLIDMEVYNKIDHD